MVPIIGIFGAAGSGKNALGDAILKLVPNSVSMGFADPIKALAHHIFAFKEESLWGPSEEREKIIERPEPCPWGSMLSDATFDHARARDAILSCNFISKRAWIWEAITKIENTPSLTIRYALQNLLAHEGKGFLTDETIRRSRWLLNGDCEYNRLEGIRKAPGAICNMVVLTDGRMRNEILAIKEVGGMTIKITRKDNIRKSNHPIETELDTIPDSFFDIVVENDGKPEELGRFAKKITSNLGPWILGLHQ